MVESTLLEGAEREKALSGDEENSDDDVENKSLMVMMKKMNDNMNSVLKRLSGVEAVQERPAAKKRRVAMTPAGMEVENNLSEEGEISDSEKLTEGENDGEAPVPNTSVAEDELLSEIAQQFADEKQTSADICQKLAEIVNQRWSSKLEESKLKDKMSKYDRPNN